MSRDPSGLELCSLTHRMPFPRLMMSSVFLKWKWSGMVCPPVKMMIFSAYGTHYQQWMEVNGKIVLGNVLPGAKEALFEPANSKVYRHPTFFPMPEDVKHI